MNIFIKICFINVLLVWVVWDWKNILKWLRVFCVFSFVKVIVFLDVLKELVRLIGSFLYLYKIVMLFWKNEKWRIKVWKVERWVKCLDNYNFKFKKRFENLDRWCKNDKILIYFFIGKFCDIEIGKWKLILRRIVVGCC